MAIELKPCPFCKEEKNIGLSYSHKQGPIGSISWDSFILCDNCGARGPYLRDGAFQPGGIPDKLKELWNIRH